MQSLKTVLTHKNILWRGLPALLLIFTLGAPMLQAVPIVQAAAPADDTATATITLFAPGAALGDPVWVEYTDGAGHWFKVDGWLGTLDSQTLDLNVPYKQWTVFEANFGQGPFRWVVLNADGSVWGISDSFNLPAGGNINQTETIVPGVTGGPLPAATMPAPAAATPAPAATATAVSSTPTTAAGQFTDNGSSTMGYWDSTASVISAYFMGLPADSWIAVQWGDGLGHWETVSGWEGTADSVDAATGQLFKQWTVAFGNFGQGPFRWAVFDHQGGNLLGYSASFNLPVGGGMNWFMSMSK